LGEELLNGEPKIDIRFNYNQKFILVDIKFSILPLTFILDTGAEHLILFKKEYSDILGLKYDKRINLIGADLNQEVYALITRNIPFQVGKSKVINRDFIVLEEDFLHLDKLTGESIDGIIGGRLMRGIVLELDYKKRKLSLHDRDRFKTPGKGFTEVDIEIRNHKPYIKSNLTLDNGEKIEVDLLLDSGAALPFLLLLDTDSSLQLPEKVVKGHIGRGLGGNVIGFMSQTSKFELTPNFVFEQLLTSYQDVVDPQNLTISDKNGLLGNPLLERFHIFIDYVSNKLYLKPHKNYNKKFKFDMSGLVLYAFGQNLDNYYVKNVVEGSPAEEAGILPGDRIVRVGLVRSKMLSLPQIYNKLKKKEGKKVKLHIEREGKTLKKSIVLRDFFKKMN